MARPRKSAAVSTGKISKFDKNKRLEAEKKNRVSRDELIAPDWLPASAKQEFERVVYAAGEIDLLDNLDLGILAIYANAYIGYVETTKQLQETGPLDKRENRYETYETVHPLMSVQDKYIKQIMQCSSKLGLATTDRLKLIVPIKEENTANKYLKYLNG